MNFSNYLRLMETSPPSPLLKERGGCTSGLWQFNQSTFQLLTILHFEAVRNFIHHSLKTCVDLFFGYRILFFCPANYGYQLNGVIGETFVFRICFNPLHPLMNCFLICLMEPDKKTVIHQKFLNCCRFYFSHGTQRL